MEFAISKDIYEHTYAHTHTVKMNTQLNRINKKKDSRKNI